MKRKISSAILVLLFVVLISSCSFRIPDPDQRAQEFLDGLEQGEYEQIYQMLTMDAKERIEMKTFVKHYRQTYDKIGKVKLELKMITPPEDEDWEIEDDQVEIPVEGKMSTWTVGHFEMDQVLHMVYEDKEWKIDWQTTNILPQLYELSYRVEVTRTPAERGNFYAQNGEPLTGKGIIYKIGLVPGKIEDKNGAIEKLSTLLDMTPNRIEKKLGQKWVRPHMFVPLRSITEEEWKKKKDEFIKVKGILASRFEKRLYFGVDSLASTIGYLSEINAQEVVDWKRDGYKIGDLVGRTGLERKFEKELSGKPGYMIRVVDENNKEQAMIKFVRPIDGKNFFLTLDHNLQKISQKAMGERNGLVLAMNPKSGEIKAIGSFPGYDPNEFQLGRHSTRLSKLLNNPQTPLLNRVIQGKYIPGSTFKPVTILAALEYFPEYDYKEEIETDKTWRAEPGWGNYRVKRVSRPEGKIDLFDAMKWSDNIYFARLAYNMGSEPLNKISEKLGFEEEIPFVLETTTSKLATRTLRDTSILLADTGYGQGQLQLSPLHLALIYSGLATDKIPQPLLLSDSQGEVWKDNLAADENLELLQQVLKVTVQDEEAVANEVAVPGLDMAGKTGTAQFSNQEMGWFVTYLPADNPEMLLLVGVEDANHGSHDAMAITREILTEYFELTTQ